MLNFQRVMWAKQEKFWLTYFLAYLKYTIRPLFRHEAYKKIKHAVVTLRFEMGKTLSEQELCAELGLGRTPVREALQLLASEGLVVIMPRKGAKFRPVSFTDLQKIFETRVMLESYCVSDAAKKISATEIDRLRSLLSDIPKLVGNMDMDALLWMDRQIHMGVVRS